MPCIPPVYFVAFCLLNEYILLIKKNYIYIPLSPHLLFFGGFAECLGFQKPVNKYQMELGPITFANFGFFQSLMVSSLFSYG